MPKIVIILLVCSMNLKSQKEASWWFFGFRAGMHFQTNSVTIHPGLSPLNGGWGFSSISDSAGNLLFYSNYSDYVFNKMHDTMANGINVGGAQGPQPSLIMPKSGNLYYLLKYSTNNFYTPGIPPMLSYSIIDMSLASGNGSVTAMNVPISPPGISFAKMAGARHCNGNDYWLLTHRADMPNGSNQFYAYLVSNSGVSNNPVISTIGSNQYHHYLNYVNYHGRMKFSPNGKKLCSVYPYRTVELYDFDNSTGQLSNVIKLDSVAVTSTSLWPIAYDVEFSPDGTKLYVNYLTAPNYAAHPCLCQFDLTAGSAQAIANSKTIIDSTNSGSGDLQLGINGKIYLSRSSPSNPNNLAFINNPNLLGSLCNFDSIGINMGIIPSTTIHAAPNIGLPSFISNYFEQKPSFPAFTYTASCGLISFYSPTVTAFPATGYSVSSYQWSFGDPITGVLNTSTLSNPTHVFSSNGTYQIKLLLNYNCGTDTLKQTVQVTGLPALAISGKTTMCQGEKQTLNFSGVSNYSLNGNSIPQASASIQPTANTIYTVTGYDSASSCTTLKTFTVTLKACLGMEASDISKLVVNVYPNPTQEKVTIESSEDSKLTVLDFTGKIIYEKEMQKGLNELDLKNYLSGIYFLRLSRENKYVTVKLLKE